MKEKNGNFGKKNRGKGGTAEIIAMGWLGRTKHWESRLTGSKARFFEFERFFNLEVRVLKFLLILISLAAKFPY